MLIRKWLTVLFLLFLTNPVAQACYFYPDAALGADSEIYGPHPEKIAFLIKPWSQDGSYQSGFLDAVKFKKWMWLFTKEIHSKIKLCPFFQTWRLPSDVVVPIPCQKIGLFSRVFCTDPGYESTYYILFDSINRPEENKFTDQELEIRPEMANGKANLVGEPLVFTPAGPRRIGELKPGDAVFALDMEAGEWAIDHVVLVEQGWCRQAVKISYVDNPVNVKEPKDNATILTGAQQRFWSSSVDDWTTADKLTPGDFVLLGPAPGNACTFLDLALITKVELVDYDNPAWRLELLNHHNFLDCKTGLLFHNTNNNPAVECNDWSANFLKFFKREDMQTTLQRAGRLSCEHYDQTDPKRGHSNPLICWESVRPKVIEDRIVLPLPHRYVAIKIPRRALPSDKESKQLRSLCTENLIEKLCIYHGDPPQEKKAPKLYPEPSSGLSRHTAQAPRDWSKASGTRCGLRVSRTKLDTRPPDFLPQVLPDAWNCILDGQADLHNSIIPALATNRLAELLRQNNERQTAELAKNLKQVPELIQAEMELERVVLDALCQADIPEDVWLISLNQFLEAGLFTQAFGQKPLNFHLHTYLRTSGLDIRTPFVEELCEVYNTIRDGLKTNRIEKIEALEDGFVDLIKQSHNQSSQSGASNYLKAMAFPGACIALCAGLELCKSGALFGTVNPIGLSLCLAKHAVLFAAVSTLQGLAGQFLQDKQALKGGVFSLALASAAISAQSGAFFVPGQVGSPPWTLPSPAGLLGIKAIAQKSSTRTL